MYGTARQSSRIHTKSDRHRPLDRSQSGGEMPKSVKGLIYHVYTFSINSRMLTLIVYSIKQIYRHSAENCIVTNLVSMLIVYNKVFC